MLIVTLCLFAILFFLLASGVWIGLTLAITGTVSLALWRSIPLDKLLPQYAWNILTTLLLDRLEKARETLRELMQLDKSLAEALLSRMSARLGSLGKRLRAFDETLEQTTRLSAMASMGMHPAPVTYN